MSKIPPEQLFTFRQVARALRVGEKQIREWVRKGELAVIDIGDAQRPKKRVSQADLQKFIEARRVVHRPPVPTPRPRPATGKQWF